MAKNSVGKMNMADQKDGNKQSYPKKGAMDSLPAMGGKGASKGGKKMPMGKSGSTGKKGARW